jgi:hypothetical protein
MENYQKAGIATGVIGVIIGLVLLRFLDGFFVYFGVCMFVASMISVTILVPVSSSGKHRKTVGIIVLLMGVFFNWLLIIPGIMAIRYRPKPNPNPNPNPNPGLHSK